MSDQDIVEEVKAELEGRSKEDALALADEEEETAVELARFRQNYDWLESALERGADEALDDEVVGYLEGMAHFVDEEYWDDSLDELDIPAIYNDVMKNQLNEEDRETFREMTDQIHNLRPKALDAIEGEPDTKYVEPSEPEGDSRLDSLWDIFSYVTGAESKHSLFGTFSNSEKGKPRSTGEKAAWQITTDDDPNRGGDKPLAGREGYDMTRRGFLQTAGATGLGLFAYGTGDPDSGPDNTGGNNGAVGSEPGGNGTGLINGDQNVHIEGDNNSVDIDVNQDGGSDTTDTPDGEDVCYQDIGLGDLDEMYREDIESELGHEGLDIRYDRDSDVLRVEREGGEAKTYTNVDEDDVC